MKRLSDTSPEAQRVFDDVYRRMSPGRKWELLNQMFRFGRALHEAGYRLRKPDATPTDVRDDWVVSRWGQVPRRPLREEDLVEIPTEMHRVVREVIGAFETLGIDYAVGGSLASSLHGINRNTADADISVEPFPGKESQLVSRFGPDYYVSRDAVQQAVRDRSTFNIINTVAGFKVDVFVRKDRPFELSVMQRRSRVTLPQAPDEPIDVVSPEDIVLLKLEWYRLGGEVADQQWADIGNVLRVRAASLDRAYLEHWAEEIGVKDLLDRALDELDEG
jgi:hypothetical protein